MRVDLPLTSNARMMKLMHLVDGNFFKNQGGLQL